MFLLLLLLIISAELRMKLSHPVTTVTDIVIYIHIYFLVCLFYLESLQILLRGLSTKNNPAIFY